MEFKVDSSSCNFLQYGLIMTLQLGELLLQVLQPLFLISDVHHRGGELLWLEQLL